MKRIFAYGKGNKTSGGVFRRRQSGRIAAKGGISSKGRTGQVQSCRRVHQAVRGVAQQSSALHRLRPPPSSGRAAYTGYF